MIIRCKIVCVVLGVLALSGMSATAQDLDVVSYDIEVSLDPETHELRGSESVRWRNTTSVPTSELWFHLYLNAFASSETTFMREFARDPMGEWLGSIGVWGSTKITRLVLADGTDLMPAMNFERPDDANESDFTVVRVVLPREVLPGEAATLELDFEAQLPQVVARTGFSGDFHMVGQWFPKVGVFEGPSGWNCHQFHATSEFFADFGDYRVRLTIPRGWVVGATGEEISRAPVGTDDVVEFSARGVHDFAWTTAPPDLMAAFEVDFDPGRHVPMVWLERAGVMLDLGAVDLELPPMTIRFLVPQAQGLLIPRMIRAARLAVAWFGLYVGPYPHAQLTVVSPPPGAGGAGGMEYPTLITTGASRLDASPLFSWRATIEAVTVHEFGHQYFQGMVASNEFEQAWLDEGLTSWAENRCLDDIIADRLAPGIRFSGGWAVDRLWSSFADPPVTIDRPTWEHRLLSDSFLASYAKTSLAVRTLEGLLGEDRLVQAVRSYVATHRFSHPDGSDFQAALEAANGEDLEWFFDAVIRGDRAPDWAVLAVRHKKVDPAEGMKWREGAWAEIEEDDGSGDDEDDPWQVVVEVGRRGDLQGPVEVEMVWADGRSERRQWNGLERWTRWEEESKVRLQRVIVDPDGVWVLETRRADNYWRDEPSGFGPGWWLNDVVRLLGLLTVPWA